jgi:small subunit ribosomal protein S7
MVDRVEEAQLDTIRTDAAMSGVKFGMPKLPLPSNAHLKHRYDPIVEQVTTLLMWDGKLNAARKVSWHAR